MSVAGQILIRATNLFAQSLVILILARVLLSWFYPNMRSTAVFWVWRLSEPILEPIRRILPAAGRIDLAPWVALALVWIARSALVRLFYTLL